jgi:ribosomal-protein-alanine N-acetyltransferase
VTIPILETARLILRPFVAEDDRAIFALASDPLVAHFVRFEAHRTIADTHAFLELVRQHYEQGEIVALAIALKDEDRLIGSCGFVSHATEERSAEIGYWIGRPYWGKGYATEAGSALMTHGFKQMGLARIVAKCSVENYGSQRVLAKLGMTKHGTDRSERIKGTYPELGLYAISRGEWLREV